MYSRKMTRPALLSALAIALVLSLFGFAFLTSVESRGDSEQGAQATQQDQPAKDQDEGDSAHSFVRERHEAHMSLIQKVDRDIRETLGLD